MKLWLQNNMQPRVLLWFDQPDSDNHQRKVTVPFTYLLPPSGRDLGAEAEEEAGRARRQTGSQSWLGMGVGGALRMLSPWWRESGAA